MMRNPEPWSPTVDAAAAAVAELRRELDRLREELLETRAELAQERARRSEKRRTHGDFLAPVAPARTWPPEEPSTSRGGAAAMPAPPPADAFDFGADPSASRVFPREAPPAPFATSPTGPTFVLPRDQGIDFGAIKQLSPEELDALPFGLITLDAEGRIIHYNDTESRMVGLPKHKVIGRRFFGEVAPCARVREFEGRFLELVRDPYRVRVQTFDFVFRFANGAQQVTIVITPAKERGQYHMAFLRRG
jgi:photoactive yellow protein